MKRLVFTTLTVMALPVLVILFYGFWVSMTVGAASPVIQVTTTDDELNEDGDCSLREAITAANTDLPCDNCKAGSGHDVIKLKPFETYTLVISGKYDNNNSTGDLDITDDLTIDAKFSTINANGLDRIFDIHPGLVVEINRAVITGGKIDDIVDHEGNSDDGGGILNRGSTVTVNECTITGNVAGDGGGIGNFDGDLTLSDSTVSQNMSTHMFGGGIASAAVHADSSMTVNHCVVTGNLAIGTTAEPVTDNGSGGGIGNWVPHYSEDNLTATMAMYNSSITDNDAVGNTWNRSTGGGIMNYVSSGTGTGNFTATDTTVSGNTAIVAGGIQNGTFVIYPNPAHVELILNRCTISNNISYPSGINSGVGGGIQNTNGTILCVNSTISGNIAQGNPTFTQGFGGGILNAGIGQPTLITLINSTVTGNTATIGGGIVNADFTGMGIIPVDVVFHNTIIAENISYVPLTGDCYNGAGAAFWPDGYNLNSDYTCGFAMTADPMLGPLQDNGGPTETHALLAGSPAIDSGNTDTCDNDWVNGIDQRGMGRGGVACDLGAYEYHEIDEND